MTVPRLLRCVFVAFAVLAALLVLFVNRNLASLAEALWPGSLWWTHGALLCLEAVAFFQFWRGLFGGRRHLLLPHDAGPEAGERFARELARRLRSNPYVREAGITPSGSGDPDDAERVAACMDLLRAKANEEIERNAKRIFLATALSQNGRLDALIVFCSLCRLVWRISALYNQRPHPREIASLYWAVVSSTFLALSLDELDLTTEISVGFSQAFHAVAPAGLTASIPFAGKALQTFTASAIDGAVNCYLALRAGIIARNAYAYAFQDKRPTRAEVYREAGSLLLAMSASLMDKLAKGLIEALTGGVMESAQNMTVQAGKDIVHGVAQGIGRTGAAVGASVSGAVADAGAAVTGAAADVVDAAATATRSAVTATVDVTAQAGKDLVHGVTHGIGRAGAAVGNAVANAGSAVAGVTVKPLSRLVRKNKNGE
jgi:hypothetical protein